MQDVLGGFSLFMDPTLLGVLLAGVALGLFFGVVPGLTATLGVILAIPLTYGMSAATGIAALMGIYVGGISGGLVSATLMGMPGTPSSVATTFDGFPLARKGQAGRALGFGVTASLVGGIISGLALVSISPLLADLALSFGPFEYTTLFLFGITVIIGLAGSSPSKAFMAAMLGLCCSLVGMDPVSGFNRADFGLTFLESGINYFPVLMGFFVVAEILSETEHIDDAYIIEQSEIRDIFPPVKELLQSWGNLLRSSCIGVVIGILPGVGPALSNFLAYDQAKKASKHPETFGQGNVDGIMASESANNATVGGALIPLLTLGIPGDATTAAIMGGFILHSIRPGPLLFQDEGALVYCLFFAYFAAVILMYFIMMYGGVKFFAKTLRLPKYILLPVIGVMCVAGAYNLNNQIADVWVTLAAGFVGYLMSKHGYPRIPVIIALILGPMFEQELRRAMDLSGGSLQPFMTRPICLVFMGLLALSLVMSVYLTLKKRGSAASA